MYQGDIKDIDIREITYTPQLLCWGGGDVRDWKFSAGPGATRPDHRLGWKWVPKGLQTVLLDPGPSFPTWTEARSLRLNGQGPPSLRLGAAGSTRGPLGRAGAPHPCVQECRVAQACRSRRGVPVLARPERDQEAAPQRPPRAPALPLQPSLPFPPSPGRRTPHELPATPASKGSMARAASSSSARPPSSSASTPIFSGGQPQSSCCTVS